MSCTYKIRNAGIFSKLNLEKATDAEVKELFINKLKKYTAGVDENGVIHLVRQELNGQLSLVSTYSLCGEYPLHKKFGTKGCSVFCKISLYEEKQRQIYKSVDGGNAMFEP